MRFWRASIGQHLVVIASCLRGAWLGCRRHRLAQATREGQGTSAILAAVDVHRPLSPVDIVDRSVALYRAQFRLLFVIALIAGAITFALQALSMVASPALYAPPAPDQDVAQTVAAALSGYGASSAIGVVSWFLNLWTTCALVYAISRCHVGLEVGVGDAFRQTVGRVPYLFVTSLVLMVVSFVAVFGVALLFGGMFGAVGTMLDAELRWPALIMGLMALAGVGLLLFGLVWVLRFWLHPATVVVEGLGIGAALTRSSELMRQAGRVSFRDRNDVRLTIVLTVLPILGAAVTSLALLPVGLLGWASFVLHWIDFTKPDEIVRVLMLPIAGVQLAIGALVTPLSIAVTVLFYYDLRYRNEGLDLEMRAFALRKPRPARVASSAS